MSKSPLFPIDPALDLVLTRETTVSAEKVWRAWTEPELLKQWFCPRPYRTTECRIDLRPGGGFYTQMESPTGEPVGGGEACYLEVVPNERLVWTSALTSGYRPKLATLIAGEGNLDFTAIIDIWESAGTTTYRVTLVHAYPESKVRHEAMGFDQGWGTAFDQLVELMSSLPD